ncbi:lipoprotein [Roseobacter sp. OBYS 0001]|nr:lipoprotein [Roseobacter sp. OBYS 0001]
MSGVIRSARLTCVAVLLLTLAGCAGGSFNDATVEEAQAVAYVPRDAPKLTVFTVVNNRTGNGGHSALMVSGSQQVIFDPAGSFEHERIRERGDVLYGMSPGWVAAYKSAHARDTYHVVSQEIAVTPEQAERALALVQSNGGVGSAFCANATSSILRQVPGFEEISVTFFPVNLMDQIDKRDDVETSKYYENDAGDVLDGINAAPI